jgi:segregation and condensation protein A
VIRKALRMVHKVRAKVQSIAARVMEMNLRLTVGTRVLLRDLLDIGIEGRRAQLLVTFLSLLELGRMGYVTLFQNETYGDIHIETLKPVESNVLERVQEFDSGDAASVVASIINEAIEEKIDLQEAMVPDGPQLDLSDEVAALSESQLEVAEGTNDGIIDGTTQSALGIATDDDILAAEAEIGEA